MPIVKRVPRELALVYLYDPFPLTKFALDPIRTQTPFSLVVSAPEPDFIGLFAPEKRVRVTIQAGRLEYTDENESGFEARDITLVKTLWTQLPPLSVKALGVNIHERVTVESYPNSGQFVRDRFLNSAAKLQEELGRPIIGNATRIIYGEPDQYFDLRLTPLDIGTEWLHIQMHYHKAAHLADPEKVFEETASGLGATLEELLRVEKIVWVQ